MATQPSRKFMTYQEFEDLPRYGKITELLDGEYFVVSPAQRHQRIALELTLLLGNFLKAHPEHGRLLQAPFDVVLSRTLRRVIQPDLIVMTAETLTRIEHDNRLIGMPDLAIEVLSGDGRYDRGKKLHFYAEYQVRELWHVSQDRPRIEIYRTDPAGKLTRTADLGEGEKLLTPLLPGFELAIDALYQDLHDPAV